MANTYVDYTATAGQTDFAFSFPYLEDSHVVVEVEGVNQALTTNYTIETSPAQKIVLSSPTTAIAGGELVRIKRVSDPSTNLVDFVNGSVLTETELDRAYLHNRYLSEEAYDGVNAGLGELEGSTNYNANNKQIKNLADGTLATDAVNKGYVDTQIALTDTNLAGFYKSTHTGNAVDNVFTLSFTPQTTEAEAYIVSIDGLVQVPDTDYTIGATAITFNTIPASSAEICVVATAAASVATVNEAQVTATGSSTARSLADRFAEVFNIRDYGAVGDGSTDDTDAWQALLTAVNGQDAIIDTSDGEYLITEPLTLTSNNKYKFIGYGTFKASSAFADGGTYENQHLMTLSGNAPVELETADIDRLFYNYVVTGSTVTAKKGDRIVISDNDVSNRWGGSGDYREHTLSHIDYNDTANNVVNFKPCIDFPVTYSDASTQQIVDTNILVKIYNEDIEVVIQDGISFKGGVNPLSGSVADDYGKGLKIARGKFFIHCDFSGLHDAVRAEECELFMSNSRIEGSYSSAGGNGLKLINASYGQISDCKFLNARHGIAVAGSNLDGAEALVVNCVFGDTRQSNDYTLYPGNESRAVDTHGNAKYLKISNCKLYGGLQYGGKRMDVHNTLIRAQSVTPIEQRTGDIRSGNEAYFYNCDITIAPRIISNDDVSSTPGIGTKKTEPYFMQWGYNSGFTDSILEFYNCKFSTEDNTTWEADTILYLETGSVKLKKFVLDGCVFDYEGSNVREIAVDPYADECTSIIRNNFFIGCGLSYALRNSSSAGLAFPYKYLLIENNQVFNTDETSGQFSSFGISIAGETLSTAVTKEIHVVGNVLHTFGTAAGITMTATAKELTVAKGNSVKYTGQYTGPGTGTMGYGLRTSSNENITTGPVQHLDGNTIISPGGTITTGIQINGLSGANNGLYTTGTNCVDNNATTKITISGGTAITAV